MRRNRHRLRPSGWTVSRRTRHGEAEGAEGAGWPGIGAGDGGVGGANDMWAVCAHAVERP